MAKTFAYRARDRSGKLVTGFVEAEGESAAVARLRAQNYYIVDIRHAQERSREIELRFLFEKKVKAKDLAVYCRQFGTMIEAGVPILNCLFVLEEQTENKKLAAISGRLAELLQEGRTLTEAVELFPSVFPGIFTSMIEAGEVSGSLDQSMERLALHFEKEHDIKEKVKSAMTYPAVVVSVAFVSVLVLLTFVLPTMVSMLIQQNVPLPLPTRVVIGVSGFMKQYWPAVFGGLASLLALLIWYSKTERGGYLMDRVIISLPVFGPLVIKMSVSRFSRTLGTLVKSGVPLLQSLEIVKKTAGNRVVAKAVRKAEQSVRDGQSMSEPLAKSGVFPPMVTQMIRVGEDTGALDSLLEKVAAFYDREVDATVTRLASLVEPILIIFIGGIVGTIVASIMLPMFRLVGTVY